MLISSKIIDRILKFKGFKTDVKLAKYWNVSATAVTSWRTRNSIPFKKIIAFCEDEGVSLDYIFNGEGDMLLEDKKSSLYNKVEDEDPEIVDLLSKTIEILKSDTDYSASLAANVRSFHHAIKTENRLNRIENEIGEIKSFIKNDRREGERRQENLEPPDGIDRRSGSDRRKRAVGE